MNISGISQTAAREDGGKMRNRPLKARKLENVLL
jgi:hypothetical protein